MTNENSNIEPIRRFLE